jgi:hypothetical protein
MELYTIYWEEASQRHSEAAMLYTFQQAESCMRKARRKIPPQTPNTLLEIDGILKTSDVFQVCFGSKKEPFFETTISLEDTTCVIFIHLRTLRENGRVEQLHIEASIEVTPPTSAPYYLLTVHAFNTPLVYVIMTAKTLSGYSAVFAYLRERFSDYIAPNNIITDFEGGLVQLCRNGVGPSQGGGNVARYVPAGKWVRRPADAVVCAFAAGQLYQSWAGSG